MPLRKDWMTDDQWYCYNMIADWSGGFHHVAKNNVHEFGFGICYNYPYSKLSTYDFSGLTKLVFLAHDRMIRVEIQPSGPGMVKLCLHRRFDRYGHMNERHPTIEKALADYRVRNPRPVI